MRAGGVGILVLCMSACGVFPGRGEAPDAQAAPSSPPVTFHGRVRLDGVDRRYRTDHLREDFNLTTDDHKEPGIPDFVPAVLLIEADMFYNLQHNSQRFAFDSAKDCDVDTMELVTVLAIPDVEEDARVDYYNGFHLTRAEALTIRGNIFTGFKVSLYAPDGRLLITSDTFLPVKTIKALLAPYDVKHPYANIVHDCEEPYD